MKKILALFLALVMLFSFSACSESDVPDSGMTCQKSTAKPSSGNYFCYVPIIDLFSPGLGDVHFSDYDGVSFVSSQYSMPTGAEDESSEKASFIINGETCESEKLGFFKSKLLFENGNYYYIGFGKNSEPAVFERNENGSESELFSFPNDSVAEIYRSFGYIISASYSDDRPVINFHNIASGNLFTYEGEEHGAFAGVTFTMNGCFVYQSGEKLIGINPEKPNREYVIRIGPEKAKQAVFDGENFLWMNEDGIFIKEKNGETLCITEEAEYFAFLGGDFVYWYSPKNTKLELYRPSYKSNGGYVTLSPLEFVFANEEVAVFRNHDSFPEGEYISVKIKRFEESLEFMDAPDMGPDTVAADGYLYYCFREDAGTIPEDAKYDGYITSVYDDQSSSPRRNGQTNYYIFLGSPYIFNGEELLIGLRKGDKFIWYRCEKSHALSEINFSN